MDNAINTGRKFPSYTTSQLRASLAATNEQRAALYLLPLSAETRSAMELEVARREAGLSKTFHEKLYG